MQYTKIFAALKSKQNTKTYSFGWMQNFLVLRWVVPKLVFVFKGSKSVTLLRIIFRKLVLVL